MTDDAALEAEIERHRPDDPQEPATSGLLRHLNRHGLLHEALLAEASRLGVTLEDYLAAGGGSCPTITKGSAFETMAAAQRRGIRFDH